MQRFDTVCKLAALVLCLWVSVSASQATETDQIAAQKMSVELREQLDRAAPDQLVTAIVRLRDTGPPASSLSSQGRAAVFSGLRQNADASQRGLLGFLDQASVKARRGVVRPFWIDNIVLVQAPKDVIEQIARRRDVTEVFDNYTVTLPPRERDPIVQSHQTQPWDNIAHIGAK